MNAHARIIAAGAHPTEAQVGIHSIEAEQALLGAVLINNDAFQRVSGIVEPEDFFEPAHQQIFDVVGKLIRFGKVANPITLKTYLPADVDIAGMPLGRYLARLCAEATTIINAPDYARTIRDMADQRRIGEVGTSLCKGEVADPAALAAEGIERLDAIVGRRGLTGAPSLDMAHATVRAVDAIAEAYRRDGRISGTTWGLRDLDDRTLGMQPGELVVAAGRPGMGKTALAIDVAVSAAEAEQAAGTGNVGLFVSLEMGDVSLTQRALANLLYDTNPIPYWRMRSGKVSEAEFGLITEAANRLGTLPLRIEQQPGLTVAQIAARARQVQRRTGLAFLMVDHLHLVRASERYAGQKVAETGEVSSALKALAKEMNIPVLALCQLSRAVEGREDKRPTLADLRWSGDIEQDADLIVMLYREFYYLERKQPSEHDREEFAQWLIECDRAHNRLEAIIEKQRNGPIGRVELFVDIQCNAIRNLSKGERPQEAML